MRRVLNPEVIGSHAALDLNFGSRCITFQKQAEDTRRWDAHYDF